MPKSAKLVFFGTENFSVPSLQKLLDEKWDIAAVVTKPDTRRGRGQKLASPQVKTLAGSLPVFQPSDPDTLLLDLQKIRPSHGVLVAYGKIISQRLIDTFPGGIINLHPSLLPKYRGPSPIEAAILNGDKETGLSLMKLSAKMDAGPVYAQRAIQLNGNEDRLGLYNNLARVGAEFLSHNLAQIVSGELKPQVQDNAQASYTKLLKKADGIVDWSKPATVLEREIRAFLGFPKSVGQIHGHSVVIIRTRVARSIDDGALVQPCGQGFLEILELISPVGRKISGRDFLNGYL